MSTIKDVARLANVSVATVSRVMNNSPKASAASREVVQKAMAELGYTPNANARALVSKTCDTMGVLVGDVADPFFGALIKGVAAVAVEQGLHLLMGNGFHRAQQERESIDLLIGKRCEALVVHSKALSDEELIDYALRVPGMVLINRDIPALKGRCIALNNRQGAATATRHLLELGHRHIAFLSSDHAIEDATLRLQGYQDALTEAGLRAMLNLLAKGQPITAVVAYNDAMAAGAISVLADNGLKVPEEVSVVGFDDIIYARYLRPKLSTMRYPIELMAAQAAKLALQLAAGESEAVQSRIYTPTLINRHSVAPVRA
ncbi:TPA: substrate-binding domain-containing protein [Aeromonas salmonicida subsp. salmonicida]|uniref:substrate-binding domain-containing protein n=1 Tax=Aeromonas salmonicida TaxID=645 RepID=UPI00131FAE65|nr:substrate-binding domain-containing protein [Aeromonas salmonicida]ELI6417635.1 substrate-binding domain-containing protein [Aeromonas salmonicida subsp. salmonicida]ELM3647646.1 substrate-binding domain-containing protein [Aeromonas salmonicida subsp. salmonicida]QHE43964.1 substrate-binding domain-containing protein [Aeromonas salmonicida subsp. salmonicida]QHE49388.1 substrate-binding domain-containing protein [Aeromonas salmonicida subsp. salmonicida]QJF56849.1 substrate-binding domain-